MKDVDELISILETSVPNKTGTGFSCPVCGTSYKTETGCTNHMRKVSCIDMRIVCGDNNELNLMAYGINKSIRAVFTPNARITFSHFTKKDPMYGRIMQFVLMMRQSRLEHMMQDYLGYILATKSPSMGSLMGIANKKSNLREFKQTIQYIDQIPESKSLVASSVENFEIDPPFMMSCILRCRLSIHDVIKTPRLISVMTTLKHEYPGLMMDLDDFAQGHKKLTDMVSKL